MVTTHSCFSRSVRRAVAGLAIAIALPLMVRPFVSAQAPEAPDPADIAAGMRIFRSKADCQTCHGWAGDGRKMDTQMPDGANLRTTRLNRNGIITAIKCGRPGKEMPAFDRLAYSDGRCNNLKTGRSAASGSGTARTGVDRFSRARSNRSLIFCLRR